MRTRRLFKTFITNVRQSNKTTVLRECTRNKFRIGLGNGFNAIKVLCKVVGIYSYKNSVKKLGFLFACPLGSVLLVSVQIVFTMPCLDIASMKIRFDSAVHASVDAEMFDHEMNNTIQPASNLSS